MPEPAAWRYQKITKPMFDLPTPHVVLKGRVLTMAGGVIEDGFVELQAGKIVAVGQNSERDAASSTDDPVVEETGGTIMPGLINSHAHLNWDGIHDLARQSMDDPEPISAFKAAANMLKSLRAGVTLVRDLGFHGMNLYTKQAVEQGIFPGPRLKVCGAAIIQTGGHTYWVCREASGADEMRRAVREQVKGGADLIKIMACHDTLEFTDAELEAVIDESHRNGLPITAHATYDACIERVARFGVDCIEHGGSMSDATVALLVEKSIPVVTTFAPIVQQSRPDIARQFGIPEWKIEERQKAIADPARYAGLVKAAKAGRIHRVRDGRWESRRRARRDRPGTGAHGQGGRLYRCHGRPGVDHHPSRSSIRDGRRHRHAGSGEGRRRDRGRRQARRRFVRARPGHHHVRTGKENARMSLLTDRLAPRIVEEDGAFRTRMLNIAAGLDDVIALGRGDSDLHTPAHIVEAAKTALDNNKHHYTGPTGILPLREAISANLADRYDLAYGTDELLVMAGAQEAIMLTMLGLCSPGDEVLITSPRFTTYDTAVRLCGGTPVPVPTFERDDFALDVAEIEKRITPSTRMFVLVSPNNPTGAVTPPAVIRQIAELAIRHDLIIVADEIYGRMVYAPNEHLSIGSLPGMKERTVTLNGFSKTYSMTGWRVGYLAAPADLIAKLTEPRHTLSINTATVSQYAALAALTGPQEPIDAMINEYDKRRRWLMPALTEAGFTYGHPGGAFYIYTNVSSTGVPSPLFCERLLKETGVMVFPGSMFGDDSDQYIRISYLQTLPLIQEALDRVIRFTSRVGAGS